MTNLKLQSARVLTCVSILLADLPINSVSASWCCSSEDTVMDERTSLNHVQEEPEGFCEIIIQIREQLEKEHTEMSNISSKIKQEGGKMRSSFYGSIKHSVEGLLTELVGKFHKKKTLNQ